MPSPALLWIPLTAAEAHVPPRITLDRVERVDACDADPAAPLIDAWTKAVPHGVEHGWVLYGPPSGAGPLRLELGLDGSVAWPAPDGAMLLDLLGNTWEFTSLVAWDHLGHPLPSRWILDQGAITLEVDDRQAIGPVHVDPIIAIPWDRAYGDEAGARMGTRTWPVGDVDGNGITDLVTSGPLSTGNGAAWLFLLQPTGLPTTAARVWYGGAIDDNIGWIAAGSDLNGDGWDDLVLGNHAQTGSPGQVVALHLGGPGGVAQTPDRTFAAPAGAQGWGWSLLATWDADGDGQPDLLIGDPARDGGQVEVWAGGPGLLTDPAPARVVVGTSSGDQLGAAMSAGDVDEDGDIDLILGAPGSDVAGPDFGAVFVFDPDPAIGLLYTLPGIEIGQAFGGAVLSGLDVTGDAIDDVIVGAPDHDGSGVDRGRVYLFPGAHGTPSVISTSFWDGTADHSGMGTTVLPAGDVGGDGVADFVINSIPGALGVNRVIQGASAPIPPATTWTTPGIGFGMAAGVGDVDGDGYDDISLGVPTTTSPGPTGLFEAGELQILRGFPGPDNDSDGWFAGFGPLSDCDDTNPDINPGADEICDPADMDEDCDGRADDLDTALGASVWYVDLDGDGLGSTGLYTCDPDPAWVAVGGDCDDGDVHVGAATTSWYADQDGDGFGDDLTVVVACQPPGPSWTSVAGDCDDRDPSTAPGKPELCNQRDDDCDEEVDEDLIAVDHWPDRDGDGFGNGLPADTISAACPPPGYSAAGTDCDDADPEIFPGAVEGPADGVDSDCDTMEACPVDSDGDSWPASGPPTPSASLTCTGPGFTATLTPIDCNDLVHAIRPDADEVCDFIDNDCDALIDDADPSVTGRPRWYPDLDVDGWGSTLTFTEACLPPPASVATTGDCDDLSAARSPDVAEVCDGVDNDCDAGIDEPGPGIPTWYPDADEDGFGDDDGAIIACDQPASSLSAGGDCDDLDPAVHPDAIEICNGKDDDCEGSADGPDAADLPAWWEDADGDGFRSSANPVPACAPPEGFIGDTPVDCDDADATTYPGAADIPDDGIDQDCEGGDATDAKTGGDCACDAGAPSGLASVATLLLAALARRRRAITSYR